jgi:enoyl-CoA hydratase
VDHLQFDPVIVRMEERSEQCRVAFIAVNNEKRLNSLNSALMRELIEAALLPTLIGWGKTRVLCFTGENITAKQALEWGLVEKIVARDKLDEGVEEWLSAIIKAGPEAIRLQKDLIGYWEKMSIADAVQEGIRTIGKAYETDEPLRMLSARITALRDRKR